MSEWQPIETAPKDGTAIWLFDGHPYLGYGEAAHPPYRGEDCWHLKASFRRHADRCDEVFGVHCYKAEPTHWMPLPAPPPPPKHSIPAAVWAKESNVGPR